jgi:hypothetical protein
MKKMPSGITDMEKTPIPKKNDNAAVPNGAPPRRIKTVEINIYRFLWFGCEPDRFRLFLQSIIPQSDSGFSGKIDQRLNTGFKNHKCRWTVNSDRDFQVKNDQRF